MRCSMEMEREQEIPIREVLGAVLTRYAITDRKASAESGLADCVSCYGRSRDGFDAGAVEDHQELATSSSGQHRR